MTKKQKPPCGWCNRPLHGETEHCTGCKTILHKICSIAHGKSCYNCWEKTALFPGPTIPADILPPQEP